MQKPGLFGMNGFMVFLLTCLSFAAQAQQQGYLILVDAENKQPFVVRVGDQSYFSSGHGHLVLSQLKDSTYKLGLRFPRKNIAEQVFIVGVHRKDLGFQLKGDDNAIELFNWQTREIIRPVYEKDSSRLLEQGIKRDDGFSKLMAAVVNDTAVMYNTYAGNGFGPDSAIANVQSSKPKNRSLTPDLNISASDQQSATDQRSAAKSPTAETLVSANPPPIAVPGPGGQNSQASNVNQQPAKENTDNLLAAKRQETHFQDSLNTARKATFKDSIAITRKRQAFLKDSLVAVRKATRDNLLMARKNGASNEELLAEKKTQQSNDSLLAVNREKASGDSLIAVNRMNFIKDSLELASGSTAGGNHSALTRVKKLREVSLKVSRKMVFLDIGKDGRADTITLFVYFEQVDTVIKNRSGGEPMAMKKPLPPDSAGVKKIQLRNKESDTTDLKKAIVKKNSTKTTDTPACGLAATESDTEVLRLAILKANSEQEKIAVAAEAFAIKCFSVSQVRFLASLLVSDKAKYGLMDAAHLHILDRDHFPELVDMLTDKNFQRKFLAMAEKRS